jgi:DNA polymerase
MNIESLNEEIRSCSKCKLSDTRINVLCGEGDINSKFIMVAQAPGKVEDKIGKMFIGPSGKVLNELLKIIGIGREEIYITNLIKCMLPKYRKPKSREIEICSNYLDKEIEIINPKVVTTLGYYASKYIFEKFSITLPLKTEFQKIYGKVFLAENIKILPLQHPAAILYDGSIKEEMIVNYRKMVVLNSDCKWFFICPMKRFYEEGRLDKKWIELYCKGDWESCIRYKMEERGESHPDWMLPDGTIDKKLYKS